MSTDLGLVELIGTEAVGQPGQRRFRVFARGRRGSAIMWMEKEQLNSLSLALDQFLAHLTQGQVLRTEAQAGQISLPPGMPANFPQPPDSDFQVAEMKISYEQDRSLFLLTSIPFELIMERGEIVQARINEKGAVTLLFTLEQAQRLSSTITLIVSAGRPVCPLCKTPLDGSPHACVKQNGHRAILLAEEEDEEEEE